MKIFKKFLNKPDYTYFGKNQNNSPHEKQIEEEKLKILHKNLLISLPANFLCVSLVFFSLSHHMERPSVLAWYLATIFITVFRAFSYYLYNKIMVENQLKLSIFMVGAICSALLWGFCALFLMPANLIQQMIIIVIIAGLTAGGLQTLMPNLGLNILYTSLIIIPLDLWLFLQTGMSYVFLGFAMFVYLLFMISTAKRGFELLMESLKLRFENMELVKILREQSIRDPLTQLFNRRFLLETIPKELRRLIYEKRNLCVSMIDIDFFKLVNDNFGHDVGDEVLQMVANILHENFRGSDIACRFGGEEFVLVIIDVTIETALVRLQAVCEKIKKVTLFRKGQQIPSITVSVGVAEAPMHGNTIEDLIGAADKALYHAKQVGRDQIEVYGVLGRPQN